ncbi:hypothetical protein GQ600_6038 [Phytophthora cactorum]|nr:hypothetical protein GQ600_6038 [Phytophthora cactorum]
MSLLHSVSTPQKAATSHMVSKIMPYLFIYLSAGRKYVVVYIEAACVGRPKKDTWVQDIVALFDVSVRHASRLQLYRDAARGTVEEPQEQAIYGEGGHFVEELLECHLSPDTYT